MAANCFYIVTRYPIREHVLSRVYNAHYYYQRHKNLSRAILPRNGFRFIVTKHLIYLIV